MHLRLHKPYDDNGIDLEANLVVKIVVKTSFLNLSSILLTLLTLGNFQCVLLLLQKLATATKNYLNFLHTPNYKWLKFFKIHL
jgi:hypothetical protein